PVTTVPGAADPPGVASRDSSPHPPTNSTVADVVAATQPLVPIMVVGRRTRSPCSQRRATPSAPLVTRLIFREILLTPRKSDGVLDSRTASSPSSLGSWTLEDRHDTCTTGRTKSSSALRGN